MRKPPQTKAERVRAENAMDAHWAILNGKEPRYQQEVPETRARKPRIGPSESQEQKAVIGWWNLACKGYGLPRFALFSVPNGAYLGSDYLQRAIQMNKLKAEGFRNGVPDLWLPIAKRGTAGLVIEMKVGDNKASDDQMAFVELLTANNFRVELHYSADSAIAAIKTYLEGA